MEQKPIFEAIFAYVGGTLSIALGIHQLVKAAREKPNLHLTTHPSYRRLEANELPAIGVVQDIPERGGRVEVVFQVRIANAGKVAIEVRGLAIISADEPMAWVITGDTLPQTVLPITSTMVQMQPGWLQHYEIAGIAALDALGRMHFLPTSAFVKMLREAKVMPLEERTTIDRFDNQAKTGFVAMMGVEKLDLDLDRVPRRLRQFYKKRERDKQTTA
jgi:hypothetical protein